MNASELSVNAHRCSHLNVYEGDHTKACELVREYLVQRWSEFCSHGQARALVDALRAFKAATWTSHAAAAPPEISQFDRLMKEARSTLKDSNAAEDGHQIQYDEGYIAGLRDAKKALKADAKKGCLK